MGRINGANSDYIFDDAVGAVVENREASPLFMKLFICPNDQNSSVEAGSNTCNGTDSGCPDPIKSGHASIRLDQAAGIILQTDVDTQIIIPQGNGPIEINGMQIGKTISNNSIVRWIRLGSNGAKIELLNNGDINFVPGAGGAVKINNVPIPV